MVTTSQAIQQQIADLARDLNNQISVQNTYRTTGTKGIQGAYAGLDKGLAVNQKDVGNIITQGRNTITNDYKQAGSNISDIEKSLRGMLGNQGGLEADVANGPLAEIMKLNAAKSLAQSESLAAHQLLGTGYNTQASQARADAKVEGTGQVAGLTSQIGADIADMQREYLKEKAAKQVEYANALAEERYRAEQMALERAKLAAENAERARAAQRDAAEAKYSGRAGVIQWAKENGVPAAELNLVLQAVTRNSQMSNEEGGGDQGAYREIADALKKQGGASKAGQAFIDRLFGTRVTTKQTGPMTRFNSGMTTTKSYKPPLPGLGGPGYGPSRSGGVQYNADRLASLLDIYYGRYSSAG